MKICPSCQSRFEENDWRCPHCGKAPARRSGYLAFAPDLADSADGFESAFFQPLAEVESGNFWFEARNCLILWALNRYFSAALAGGSFLEIGCGTGFVLRGVHTAFPALTVIGSEIFVEGLSIAQKRLPDVTLIQMDARRIPFENEFDVVGAFDVLEHIQDDQIVLRELFQAVKPGGGIIVTVPQHPSLWSTVDDYSHHYRRYTRSELTEKMIAAGFRIRRVTSFISLLLPLVVISRITRDRSPGDFDPLSEFKLSPVLNTVLARILGIERLVIQAGISFPVGSSLCVIAGKDR
jgi:SAM-dependent methyltransferase